MELGCMMYRSTQCPNDSLEVMCAVCGENPGKRSAKNAKTAACACCSPVSCGSVGGRRCGQLPPGESNRDPAASDSMNGSSLCPDLPSRPATAQPSRFSLSCGSHLHQQLPLFIRSCSGDKPDLGAEISNPRGIRVSCLSPIQQPHSALFVSVLALFLGYYGVFTHPKRLILERLPLGYQQSSTYRHQLDCFIRLSPSERRRRHTPRRITPSTPVSGVHCLHSLPSPIYQPSHDSYLGIQLASPSHSQQQPRRR
ncbi:hypothetical protein QBC41DRAFT_32445 [Cercophora samala]|uniref:Uncharacterized protein n=1 Tax=Cercophora samala TaxID=330535 RepID=A0AA39Z0Q9_9PEZI|nr:hypothetical protein QBC41DRAFT_32445 [Cercophora samala]